MKETSYLLGRDTDRHLVTTEPKQHTPAIFDVQAILFLQRNHHQVTDTRNS
jgi:hypothetical protein